MPSKMPIFQCWLKWRKKFSVFFFYWTKIVVLVVKYFTCNKIPKNWTYLLFLHQSKALNQFQIQFLGKTSIDLILWCIFHEFHNHFCVSGDARTNKWVSGFSGAKAKDGAWVGRVTHPRFWFSNDFIKSLKMFFFFLIFNAIYNQTIHQTIDNNLALNINKQIKSIYLFALIKCYFIYELREDFKFHIENFGHTRK